jgi:DNA-binding FadR family transcriptional regulator
VTNRRFRKRSDQVAEQIKMWIVTHKMSPGDKLPQEKELIALFGVSKGTMREALKALEVQGVVEIVTGPGGGAIIAAVSDARIMGLLLNYFYYRTPTVNEIYDVRKVLEPELAVAAVDHLTAEHFERLESLIRKTSQPTATADERREQRAAELDFHNVLADACPNAWLALACRFMNQFLAEFIVFRKIFMSPQREFARDNLCSHQKLLAAFRRRDKMEVRRLMAIHMDEAAAHMSKLEGTVDRTFRLRGV